VKGRRRKVDHNNMKAYNHLSEISNIEVSIPLFFFALREKKMSHMRKDKDRSERNRDGALYL
jgi:hypothetical protein